MTSPDLVPVKQAQRITGLDTLRGFALLGILVVNAQAFGMVSTAYSNPTVYGDFTGVNYMCWWFGYMFFDTKMMTIFSTLFGAGIALMWEKCESSGRGFLGLHFRRMLVLMLFGLAHAYLLWFGDILFCYSVCGMVVCWLRKLRPAFLIPIGLAMILIPFLISLGFNAMIPMMPEKSFAEFKHGWYPPAELIQQENNAYQGSWLEQMPYRASTALMFQTFLLAIFFIWRAGGLMLIGMALFKLGWITGNRTTREYSIGAAAAFAFGLPLVFFGILQNEANKWSIEYSFFLGPQFNYFASLLVAFGYMCVVMLLCRSSLDRYLGPLRAVGQMALTNYLMQTIIMTSIFYGHGLGLFGQVTRLQMALMVLAVWLFQLFFSSIWLKYFRFGPFEWLWRSMSYWKLQPMLKR